MFFYGGGDLPNNHTAPTPLTPIGETYIYSYKASDIAAFSPSASLDILTFAVMTVAFNPDNTILGVSYISDHPYYSHCVNISMDGIIITCQ